VETGICWFDLHGQARNLSEERLPSCLETLRNSAGILSPNRDH
jgi:hypothetical protein